jgi:hypothetical protein
MQITDEASRNGHRISGKIPEIARVFGSGRPKAIPVLSDMKQMWRKSAMSQNQLSLWMLMREVVLPHALRK